MILRILQWFAFHPWLGGALVLYMTLDFLNVVRLPLWQDLVIIFFLIEGAPWILRKVRTLGSSNKPLLEAAPAIVQTHFKMDGLVGLAVGIVDDEREWTTGLGKTRDDNSSQSPDSETIFEIGSVTKLYTSLVLADMVVRGEVPLDQPVRELLPINNMVPRINSREITLVDLATHTSGLPRLPPNLAPYDGLNPYVSYSRQRLHDGLAATKLTREPGTQFEYSNFGAGLLGDTLALHAGCTYEELVNRRICDPLGMENTRATPTPEMSARLAQGHSWLFSMKAKNWDFDALAGAGCLRSCLADQLIFLNAMLNPPESLAKAVRLAQEVHSQPPSGQKMGLGWIMTQKSGRELLWHNGETGGYHSFIGLDLDRRRGVVILSNSAKGVVDKLGFELMLLTGN